MNGIDEATPGKLQQLFGVKGVIDVRAIGHQPVATRFAHHHRLASLAQVAAGLGGRWTLRDDHHTRRTNLSYRFDRPLNVPRTSIAVHQPITGSR